MALDGRRILMRTSTASLRQVLCDLDLVLYQALSFFLEQAHSTV